MQENKNIIVETNFKANLKNPLKRLVFVYPVFIVALVIAGRYYVQSIDYTSDNKAIYKQIINKEKQDDDIQAKPAMMMAGVDVKMYVKATDEIIAKGSTSFATNCASCHGEKGMGDGAAGAGLNPKPRNFHSQEGWSNGTKFGEMYKTLEEGIIKNGMNSFSQLPVDERFALIHYIRSLASGYPEVTEDEMSELDLTYSLSSGKQTNNQIPVVKAMTLLAKENNTKDLTYNFVSKLESNNGTNAYNIYKKVICNDTKLVNTLNRNSSWRDGSANFYKILNANLVQNGVKTHFTKLSSSELDELYSLVKSIL